MSIQIIEGEINPDDFNSLRKAVGWEEHRIEDIKRALMNTSYLLIAKSEENKIVGMARVIGDEGLYYYIQDVIVIPGYQNKGIGRKMMEKILDYIEKHKKEGLFVGLMAAKGKEGFYKKFGFLERPAEQYGAGMCKSY